MRKSPAVIAVSAMVVAVFASASPGQGPPPAPGPPGGTPPGFEKAIAAKEKHASEILDKPGVAGIGVGLNKAGKPVIHVYKERPDTAGIPDSLDGVPVESITTGVLQPRAPTDRFPRPVPIGVSSGLAGVATGTLGARVTDGTNVYALSNNHVFAGINTGSVGDPIIQPGDADGGSDPADRIATLAAYEPINFDAGSTNTIDAAIGLTSTANVDTATPSDGYGTPSSTTTTAFVGQAVQKYGRTTGFQTGSVADVDVSVDVCYLPIFDFCLEQARFVNQFSVTPGAFSAAGDSGSLVVTQIGNQPVGLLFAGGDGLTIANPIDAVLQRFGVTIDGAGPTAGVPSAPRSLSATAGDAQVALSWLAPSSDGGSPVTAYKVYRGTSPGGESFLANTGTATSYTDTSAANGTTYYYKVSASNANGEGSLSSEASATPVAPVAPTSPLPTLDSFNRANESPLSDSGRWSNGIVGSSEAGFNVTSNMLACSVTTTCTAWRNNAQYGPDSESWARVSTLPGTGNAVRLYVRVQQPGSAAYDGYMLRSNQLAGTDEVYLERVDNGAITRLLTMSQELAAGDTLLLRATRTTLEAWRFDGTSWTRLGVTADATYSAAGYSGVGLRGTTGRLDDFGARTMDGGSAPSAPISLAATAGNASVALAWSPPTSDGGSPITAYKVYRGTSPGGESFLANAGTSTSYTDASAANGTTYYYKVTASNVVGEGPPSNETSATPAAAVPPDTPLPTLDSFNRANESPLSDSGRWSNGIVGASETGFNVTSNTLACSVTTTCTAWRNNAQYGPDSESWAKVSTLPGTGNAVRLYVRVQQPGSAAYDGYMLRTNQLAGTDEVYLERIDNGAITRLLTMSQELAAGDTLLLRARGTTLEAWRNDGASWARLGFTSDKAYAAAGYVGVGLRGTTGRLDDFGARTMGVASTVPGAPTGLQATGGNAQVALTWSAPASDGGSPITNYKVYRATSSGTETFLANAGTATSYTDTSAANGTTYYYEVSAQNAVGEGSLSSEAQATPTGPVPPAEPLSILDTFNRSNENPLSFGGRWGNGIIGSSERSLKVVSNQCASTLSTTATAWWQTQLGPDEETYATIAALPGNGNAMRLYVRLQTPGSAATDGYMLLYSQLSGTDQIVLYRMTNGALTQLATANREIAAGTLLLLRAKGNALEAWVREGSIWTRVASASDSMYAGAGYAGIGIRGKTGRLDDFGAR